MKKIILTLTFTILLVFMGTTVLATTATSGTVTPVALSSATQISEGGNLSITLRVDQITFTAGINSVVLKVSYDANIFEQLDANSFDEQGEWSVKYEPLSGVVTLSRTGLQDKPGDIVKIDFKAKTGNDGKTTVVKLTDMVFSDGINASFEPEDVSSPTITIGKVIDIPPVEDDIKPIGEDEDPKPVTPVTKDKPDEIPDTGLADDMPYIIVGLFMLAIVFYIGYKNFEKKNIRYVNVE